MSGPVALGPGRPVAGTSCLVQPGRPMAGTSCLVQPGHKLRALFLKPLIYGWRTFENKAGFELLLCGIKFPMLWLYSTTKKMVSNYQMRSFSKALR